MGGAQNKVMLAMQATTIITAMVEIVMGEEGVKEAGGIMCVEGCNVGEGCNAQGNGKGKPILCVILV